MTPQTDDFFIGWAEQTPAPYAKASRRFVWLLLPMLFLSAFLFIKGQKAFTTSYYDFGENTKLEGTLIKTPVPMLLMDWGDDINNQAVVQHILLLGAGKFGAEPSIAAIEAQAGEDLAGKSIQLEGVLSYYDGKATLELLGGTAAYLGKSNQPAIQLITDSSLGTTTLKGEIVDSKCFFGLMKPGEGKTHKSCAIRCLSGGIPPVFAAAQSKDRYYIIVGENGEQINAELLPYTADYLRLEGRVEQMGDWNILYLNAPKDICTLGPKWVFGQMPLCGAE